MDKYRLVAWGMNKEAFNELKANGQDIDYAVSSALVFYTDGTSDYVEFPTYDDFMNFYNEAMANGLKEEDATVLFDTSKAYSDLDLVSQSGISLTDKTKAAFLAGKSLSPESREKVLARIEENEIQKQKELTTVSKVGEPMTEEEEEVVEKEDSKFAKGVATGLVTAGIVGLGAVAIGNALDNDKEIVPIVSEMNQEDSIVETPSMVGKDFAYYKENALETSQKDFFVNKAEVWLNETNAQESWQRVILDNEKAKELGYTDNECVFGFTAEDAYNLALRFNDMTKEEYVTFTGGKELDVVHIMDDSASQTNGTLSKIISYYVCSDECDLNIDKIINFNEQEVALVDKFEKLNNEYKVLDTDETSKAAEEKMQEIKAELVELAHNPDNNIANAKSYVLRTFAPAASIISQTHQYQDKIEITVKNTKTGNQETKSVKTDLFDELTMRTLITGYDRTWDSEQYLENLGISSSKYNLLYNDVETSIADLSCSGQSAKLNEVNDYLTTIKMYDLAVLSVDPENREKTEYDKLIEGTYDAQIIIDMINNELVNNNTYPKNINYFNTAYIAEKQIEYKNTHGITQGKVGDKIKVTASQVASLDPSTVTDGGTIWKDKDGNEVTEEEAKEEAREEENEREGIEDEEEAQKSAEEIAQLAQQAYDAAYAHFAEGNTNDLTEWSNHEEEAVRNSYNMGKEDGKAYYEAKKEVEENPVVGGETTPVDGNGTTPTEPEPQPEPGTPETPENPTVPTDPTTPENPTVPEEPVTPENPTPPEEGITPTDPTLDPGFRPVVPEDNSIDTPVTTEEPVVEVTTPEVEQPTVEAQLEYTDAEVEALINEFASEYPELFGNVENTQENTETQGYSK